MLKYNYCWDLMDSKMDHTSFIKSKSLGTTRNYLKVSNNRDCGKVHKQCQQECKLLLGPKEAMQNKNIGCYPNILVVLNRFLTDS